jgi:hypothetical protein
MKASLLFACIWLATSAAFAAETNAPPAPLTVAVFDFEARDELGKDFGKEAATLVTAHLSGNPALWTVERAELDRLLAEQALGLSGLADPATAARVGQMIGAKVLVTGRAFRAGGELILVAKIIGTETGRVYGELAKAAKDAPVTKPAEELAGKLAVSIVAKADTLVAKVVTRADRVTALKAALKTDRRPSVSVKIPEVHFGTPSVDPAAQTELALLFKEVGCELTDDQSAKPADLEVTGEAFSEVGLRRAGLVSCKARVEIKVRDRASGKVLLAERQMSVAVDVSEQIAAKRALQEAAAELAERIIPQVVK